MQELCGRDSYTIDDLIRIIKILRSPQGCPWDQEQDHHSIRNNFLEEVYEAVEAIDREDSALLREELGDVLLQIVFHTCMEEEQDRFDFSDVCTGICRKMIGRHPHVFGDKNAADRGEAARQWERQKRREKELYTLEDCLQQVCRALPALMRAQKLTDRAEKAGCSLFTGNHEIRRALEAALDQSRNASAEESWGRLLFLIAAQMNHLGLSAEEALSHETDRMIARFLEMEHSTESCTGSAGGEEGL